MDDSRAAGLNGDAPDGQHGSGLRELDQWQQELQAAAAIQRLTTAELPDHPGLEMGRYLKQLRTLGGDFCAGASCGSRFVLSVGDIGGKGVRAAQLAAP